MTMEIISILLGILLLGAVDYGYGGIELVRLTYLIDIPSLIVMLVFTVPVLFKGGVWKDFKRAWRLLNKDYTCHLDEVRRALDVVEMMQKQVLYAGVICVLMTLITIFRMLSDPASLGPNLSVAILTMLYAMIFEMLLLPLQLEAKRRIIDYMGVDTEEENAAGKENTAAERENAAGKENTAAERESAAETENTAAERENAAETENTAAERESVAETEKAVCETDKTEEGRI